MQPARSRVPAWAWVLIGVTAAIVLVPVALIAVGVIGFSVAAGTGGSDIERDKAFTAADEAGSSACDYLDMHLAGIGSWQDARSAAAKATTTAVREAATARQMYDACVAAGANMSDWREPPG